ncbi:MAG: ACT domain-containing protein [Pseudoalteromonas sp.]|uniref:ACT domain-containing protein n=1 Tax=unclassified Pseudoalteromonas TaxID=194690 RepID=UPI003F961E4F
MAKPTLQLSATAFAKHSIVASSEIPKSMFTQKNISTDKTTDELSTISPETLESVESLSFSLAGVMSNIARVLAQLSITIFTLPTYEKGYSLIKKNAIIKATKILNNEGSHLLDDSIWYLRLRYYG